MYLIYEKQHLVLFHIITVQIRMPKRQYSDQYINFNFIELKNVRESVPRCMVCMKRFSNASMKLSLLQSHL